MHGIEQELRAEIARLTAERDQALSRMQPHPHVSHPALRAEHVANARLFANREDLVASLRPEIGNGVIAELGVATGDFSKVLIRLLAPKKFVGIDIFQMHHYPSHWGIPIETLLQGRTHRGYYEYNLRDSKDILVVEEGDGKERLESYPDDHFDMIYIDAFHTYESVVADAAVCVRKVRPGGILFFNDYIFWSHGDHTPYGVVQACNDLVVNHGYDVVGFALQQQMYCDMAIRRPH
jgi:hypothetical protein